VYRMSKQDYIDYLKSEDWRERRKELMEEANWECAKCGAKATQLHHLNYNNLQCEVLFEDVIAVCTYCHKDLHCQEEDGYGEYKGY